MMDWNNGSADRYNIEHYEYPEAIDFIRQLLAKHSKERMEEMVKKMLIPKPPVSTPSNLLFWWNRGVEDTLKELRTKLKTHTTK